MNTGKVQHSAWHKVPAKLYLHFSLHFCSLTACRYPYLLDDGVYKFCKNAMRGGALIIPAC